MLISNDILKYLKDNFKNSPHITVDPYERWEDVIVKITNLNLLDLNAFIKKCKIKDLNFYTEEALRAETVDIYIKITGFYKVTLKNTSLNDIF